MALFLKEVYSRVENGKWPGYTWVIDHVKGPEDAPLVEKTYIMNSAEFREQA